MEEARQPDSTHSMLRGDSSIQLSFSRVQSSRTYLVPSWHQTPNMSLGKLASAAAAGVANAVRPATVFKSRFTGTSRQRKGQRLDSEAPRLRSRRLGRWSRRLRIRRLRLCHFCPFSLALHARGARSALSCRRPVILSDYRDMVPQGPVPRPTSSDRVASLYLA